MGVEEECQRRQRGALVRRQHMPRDWHVLRRAARGAGRQREVGDTAGPGYVVEIGEWVLPVIGPERLVVAQRYALLKVGDGAYALEIVIVSEARVASLAHEAQQGLALV